MQKVFIVILNYKKWQDVVECLESVFRLDYENFSVVVIDNDSGNDSLKHIMDWAGGRLESKQSPYIAGELKRPIKFAYYHCSQLPVFDDSIPELIFIQNDRNAGFAGGNNIGLKLLLHLEAYVWLLNPDMVVTKDTLSTLVNFANERNPKTVSGCTIRSYSNPDEVLFYGGGRVNFDAATVDMIDSLDELPSLHYISGGSMLTHTSHLKDVGLLPEEYFLYWEETDWCYRAVLKGYEMKVCLDAVCYDKISTSIGRSFLADFYYTRNGLFFLSKYKKDKLKTALFFAYMRMVKRIVTGRWDRAKGVLHGIRAFKKAG